MTVNNSTLIKSVLGTMDDPLLRSGFQFATQQLEGRMSITTGVNTNDMLKSPINNGSAAAVAAFQDSVTSTNDMISTSMNYDGSGPQNGHNGQHHHQQRLFGVSM